MTWAQRNFISRKWFGIYLKIYYQPMLVQRDTIIATFGEKKNSVIQRENVLLYFNWVPMHLSGF